MQCVHYGCRWNSDDPEHEQCEEYSENPNADTDTVSKPMSVGLEGQDGGLPDLNPEEMAEFENAVPMWEPFDREKECKDVNCEAENSQKCATGLLRLPHRGCCKRCSYTAETCAAFGDPV